MYFLSILEAVTGIAVVDDGKLAVVFSKVLPFTDDDCIEAAAANLRIIG